jgi:hypothetical protein
MSERVRVKHCSRCLNGYAKIVIRTANGVTDILDGIAEAIRYGFDMTGTLERCLVMLRQVAPAIMYHILAFGCKTALGSERISVTNVMETDTVRAVELQASFHPNLY